MISEREESEEEEGRWTEKVEKLEKDIYLPNA